MHFPVFLERNPNPSPQTDGYVNATAMCKANVLELFQIEPRTT